MRQGEHEVEQMAIAGDHEGRRCMYVCMWVCVCVSVSVRTYVCTYECIRVVMCRRVRDNEGTEKGTMKLQVEAGLYELRSSKCAAAGGSTDGARTLTALQLQDKSGTPESVRNCDASRIWEVRTHGTVTAALSRRLEISSIWRTARFRVHTNTPDFEQVGTQHEHGIVAKRFGFYNDFGVRADETEFNRK